MAIGIFKQIKSSKKVEIFYFEYYSFEIDSKEYIIFWGGKQKLFLILQT